jgi:hypothetical protein
MGRLAGVIGFEALAGGIVLGLAGVVLGVCELGVMVGILAPLPAAPDEIGVCGVALVPVELLLGFVTTVAGSSPLSDPPHAQKPSSPSATVHLVAPRKYMIFLLMPWPSIRPVAVCHNAVVGLCDGSFISEQQCSYFGATRV